MIESIVTFGIFIFVIIICICVGNSNKSSVPNYNRSPPEDKNNSFKVNGVDITLTDEELKEQQKLVNDEFNNRKENLRNKIRNDMNSTDDYVRKKVLEQILNIPIFVESDYERVSFMYNNGQLRSNDEVHNFDLKKTYHTRQAQYNRSRHKTNAIAFWAPFWGVFLISAAAFGDVIFLPVALLFALIAGYIGMMIGYKINVDKATIYELPKDDPAVVDEKRKLTTSVVAGAVSAGSIVHNTKKAVKDVTNVDSWKELK